MDINAITQAVKAATRPAHKFHSETLKMDVYMRELTSKEADEWGLQGFVQKSGDEGPSVSMDFTQRAGHRARLVCLCLCDENGVRCDDKRRGLQIADVEAWPNRVIRELYGFASEVNGLTEEGVEDMGKESEKALVSDSSSA